MLLGPAFFHRPLRAVPASSHAGAQLARGAAEVAGEATWNVPHEGARVPDGIMWVLRQNGTCFSCTPHPTLGHEFCDKNERRLDERHPFDHDHREHHWPSFQIMFQIPNRQGGSP